MAVIMNKREKVNAGLKACVVEHFLCAECPYQEYESAEYPVRCLHRLLNDIASFDVPIPVVHVHNEYKEHDWVLDEDGNVDLYAWDDDWCNGPYCQRCHKHICIHCNPDWEEIMQDETCCIEDRFYCPVCGKELHKVFSLKCHNCEQQLSWSKELLN